jgi:hypothetical protein
MADARIAFERETFDEDMEEYIHDAGMRSNETWSIA